MAGIGRKDRVEEKGTRRTADELAVATVSLRERWQSTGGRALGVGGGGRAYVDCSSTRLLVQLMTITNHPPLYLTNPLPFRLAAWAVFRGETCSAGSACHPAPRDPLSSRAGCCCCFLAPLVAAPLLDSLLSAARLPESPVSGGPARTNGVAGDYRSPRNYS